MAAGVYIALDLGNTFWHVALGDGAHHRLISIDARDLKSLRLEIRSAKKRFNLPANAPIRSCFEAGRDGFWLHRQLESDGVLLGVVGRDRKCGRWRRLIA